MPLWVAAGLNLTETEIRYVIDNPDIITIKHATQFLHCSHQSFVRYATMYYDAPSGMNLLQLFKHRKKSKGKSTVYYTGYSTKNAKLEDIFAGKHPGYNPEKLQNRLIIEGILLEQCNICGFNARRIKDFKVPLKLAWIDGNVHNHAKENLELVCYNCFYLYHGEIFDKRYRTDPQMYKKDRNLLLNE